MKDIPVIGGFRKDRLMSAWSDVVGKLSAFARAPLTKRSALRSFGSRYTRDPHTLMNLPTQIDLGWDRRARDIDVEEDVVGPLAGKQDGI